MRQYIIVEKACIYSQSNSIEYFPQYKFLGLIWVSVITGDWCSYDGDVSSFEEAKQWIDADKQRIINKKKPPKITIVN